MNEQKLAQAHESVNLLDRAAAMASVTRQDHVSIQNAVIILRGLLAELREDSQAKCPAGDPPIRVLPDPAKA